MRPPKKKPTATKLKRWRVSIMRARGQHVGTVEAESREAAEASSVKTFKLTEEQRKRLSIWERDGCRSLVGEVGCARAMRGYEAEHPAPRRIAVDHWQLR
jgi:hypothetical protein